MTKSLIRIEKLPHAAGLPLPAYETSGSAGLDLRAAVEEAYHLEPGQTTVVPTGLKISLPEGYEGQVRPRSGLAARYGISIPNAPGTIDSDYRGEVMVILTNGGSERFTIQRGDRIAQLVVAKYERIEWEESESLETSDRGSGGFGSTGKR